MRKKKTEAAGHFSLFREWKQWLQDGYLNKQGRKPTEETIEDYSEMVLKYFTFHYRLSVTSMVRLWAQPTKKNTSWPDSRRRMMYFALLSYARFLCKTEVEDKSFLQSFAEFQPPAQNKNPRTAYIDPGKSLNIIEFVKGHDKYRGEANRAQNAAIYGVLKYTWVRNSELCGILLENVNFQTKEIYFLGKGNKWRTVVIPPELEELLKGWLKHRPDVKVPTLFLNANHEPYSRRSIIYKTSVISKHFGEKIINHDFRAAGITDALQGNVPLPIVSELAGHASMIMTDKYNRTKSSHAVEYMKKHVLLPEVGPVANAAGPLQPLNVIPFVVKVAYT